MRGGFRGVREGACAPPKYGKTNICGSLSFDPRSFPGNGNDLNTFLYLPHSFRGCVVFLMSVYEPHLEVIPTCLLSAFCVVSVLCNALVLCAGCNTMVSIGRFHS